MATVEEISKYRCKECRTITVIETTTLEGAGTLEDPVYLCRQYWSLDGTLLAIGGIFPG